jgi:DNA-binding MarR family transcriptional regulator
MHRHTICTCLLYVNVYDSGMAREDLAALFSRITRRLAAAEEPILAAHGLTMWEYITLGRLARRPAQNQAELAQAIGYDKTRLIRILDQLQRQGLIDRQPDPADRRAHLVRITTAGAARHAAAQAGIRDMEERLLQTISPEERRSLLGALPLLAREQT